MNTKQIRKQIYKREESNRRKITARTGYLNGLSAFARRVRKPIPTKGQS